MADSVGDERKDYELKKETELRLEVDENQQVVIRVSEASIGCVLTSSKQMIYCHDSRRAFSFSWLALGKHDLFYVYVCCTHIQQSPPPLHSPLPSPFLCTLWPNQLDAGTAEVFGSELARGKEYKLLSRSKVAVFTWYGCTLVVSSIPCT